MDRDQLVQKAILAEQADRFEDMAEFMKGAIKLMDDSATTTPEERNLLSVAYKNAVGSRRAAWRVISNIEERQVAGINSQVMKNYREQVEKELEELCVEVLDLVENHLVPNAEKKLKEESQKDSSELVVSLVFYLKMKGDYHRYSAEIKSDESDPENNSSTQKAAEAYKQAAEHASKLNATHPVRLGLFLNYSVFQYEILKRPQDACELAKQAFDDAIAYLDNVGEDSYKDATLIMQLLRDNLTLWASEQSEETEKQEEN
ncbi:14-3-3 protein beta/alpha-A-like [Symsagittifera roscoffensis]|uniref:14-3-3 protein beta/alpha-A-like n=1 Tax=Symsagittifera roscoffensis TaxID=84072 RepID=UPI00307B2168